MAGRRRFSDDEFDDIDLTQEEIEYISISIDNDTEDTEESGKESQTGSTDHDKPDSEKGKKYTKYHKFLIPVILLTVVVCVVAGIIIVKKTPSRKKVDLYRYYGLTDELPEFAVAVNHEIISEHGYISDGEYYITDSTTDEFFTDKLYQDKSNGKILYTIQSDIWEIPYNEKYYENSEGTHTTDYVIIKEFNGTICVNLKFLKELTGIGYYVYEQPSRVAIELPSSEFIRAAADKNATVRIKASIKGDILGEINSDTRWYSTDEHTGGWDKVVSDDGRAGYVQNKDISSYDSEKTDEFYAEPYSNQLRDHKIVLVWDGISVREENAGIQDRLKGVSGVNVISPTWYKVSGTDGSIESLADQSYIDYVRSLGLEIWPLISDFDAGKEDGFDESRLLSVTESRRNLIDNIMNEITLYGYDGFNIDFEKIKSDYGKDYIQFIRELSIECRKAGVVLSIDNYVPFTFNEFYGRKAQNECADYFIVMCYDEHYDGGEEAGSTASISYVEKGISNTLKSVDKEKLIVGVPFYSRLWKFEISGADTNILGTKAYSMNGGESIALELGLTCEWDDELKQTVASGYSGGYFYKIWLETVESLTVKLDVVKEYDAAGAAAWSLGLEDGDVWEIFSKNFS